MTRPIGFRRLGVPASLVDALFRRDITEPFPIQAATLPDSLAGRDVLGRGETGSGKTLAFGLAVLTRLVESDSTRRPKRPRALVLVPTRELAQQVDAALQPFAQRLGLRTRAVVGGTPMGRQVDAFRRGVDVLVATPGRLVDHLERGTCSLDAVEITVLDEADRMADMGFLPVVRRLLDSVPRDGQRLLFSATLDGDVDALVRGYLVDPVTHSVAPVTPDVPLMEHRVYRVEHAAKLEVTAALVRRHRRTVVFVRTKHGADRLRRNLARHGVRAEALHGDKAQGARTRALAAFSAGETPVLVATDVAARGIHVDAIDLVVHYDPPHDAKAYLHRSGRTARAGARGSVVSLVLADQVTGAQAMAREAGVEIEMSALSPAGGTWTEHPVRVDSSVGSIRPRDRRGRPRRRQGRSRRRAA